MDTPQHDTTVNFSIASIVQRRGALEKTVKSLLGQSKPIDRLNVYLNNYPDVPEFLNHPSITVGRSQDTGDITDHGKFFWAHELSGYMFTGDDDIIYPADYISKMIEWSDRTYRKAIVGVHGMIWHDSVNDYFRDRRIFPFNRASREAHFVHMTGTGTAMVHSDCMKLLQSECQRPCSTDYWFNFKAADLGIPRLVVARPHNWLGEQRVAREHSICQRMKTDRPHIAWKVAMIQERCPWETPTTPIRGVEPKAPTKPCVPVTGGLGKPMIHIVIPTIRADEAAEKLRDILTNQGITPGRWEIHFAWGMTTRAGRHDLWSRVGDDEWGVELDDHDVLAPNSLRAIEQAIDACEQPSYLYAVSVTRGKTNRPYKRGTFLRFGMQAKGLRAMTGKMYHNSGGLQDEHVPVESYGVALEIEYQGYPILRVNGARVECNISQGNMSEPVMRKKQSQRQMWLARQYRTKYASGR